jgi:hypothetical protein
MKKQAIEVRFLSDRFLKWVKINLSSMIRATLPSLRHLQPCYALLHLTALCMVLIGFPVNGIAKEQPILIFKADYEVDLAGHKYQLELYANGKVHYHGERGVNVIGHRYGKITPKQVQEILELYKKVYEKKQKSIAEFMTRYEKRYELSKDERSRLEWDKKFDIDRTVWRRYIIWNDHGQAKTYASNSVLIHDFLSILNQMINIEKWFCYPKSNPGREYCPVLTHSPDFQVLKILMESTK